MLAFILNFILFFISYIYQVTNFVTVSFVMSYICFFLSSPTGTTLLQTFTTTLIGCITSFWSGFLGSMLCHLGSILFSAGRLMFLKKCCHHFINIVKHLQWVSLVDGWNLFHNLPLSYLSNFCGGWVRLVEWKECCIPRKVIMWPWARHSAFLCLILYPIQYG